MILKGLVKVVGIIGRLHKCFLLIDTPLYEKSVEEEEVPLKFKTVLTKFKSQLIYFEFQTDLKINNKDCWVIFDKFESNWVNLYGDIVDDNQPIMVFLKDIFKNNFKTEYEMSVSDSTIESKDLFFHQVTPRFLMFDKTEKFMEDVTLKASISLNKNKPLFLTDYILHDMKFIDLNIISQLFKDIKKDEYIKFIFNFLTCMPSAETRLNFASVTEYNKYIANKFKQGLLSKNHCEDSKNFISYGRELESLFREDNFNLNVENALEILILNPFILSLIFENNYSLIPIYIVECLVSFVYNELMQNAKDKEGINAGIKSFITRAYILYVFKLLELGQSIPETSSTGKILKEKFMTELSPGNTLIEQADYLLNLHNFIAVRKYYFQASGDFIKLKSSYNTITNPLLNLYPIMNPYFLENFNFKTHIKSLWDSFVIFNRGAFIFLKSTNLMNDFVQKFIIESVNENKTENYSYLIDNLSKYTKDQRAAILNFIHHNIMIISGRAGTGKTYLITDIICEALRHEKFKNTLGYDYFSEEIDSLFIILSYTNKAISKLNENLIDKFNNKDLEIPYNPNPVINKAIDLYKKEDGKFMNKAQFGTFLNEFIEDNEKDIHKHFSKDTKATKVLLKKEIKKYNFHSINNSRHIWLSTIDSFVYKLIYGLDKIRLHNKISIAKKIYIIFDETGMVSINKLVLLLTTMINKVSELNKKEFKDVIEKIIFLGDYAQLNSIENGDLFGDLISILPLVDLKESVRYGEDKNISAFFEIIRDLQYNTDNRDKVYKYLSGMKKVDSVNDNILLMPVDDKLIKDKYFYADTEDIHDYLFRFYYKMIEDLSSSILGVEITPEMYMRTTPKNFKDYTGRIHKNRHVSYFQYNKDKQNNNDSIPDIIRNLFINNAHKFKIITLYKKEKNILGAYHISSSKRINKMIVYSLYGIRTYDEKVVFEKMNGINTCYSIPKNQMIKYKDKQYEIDDFVEKLVENKAYEQLKYIMQEIELEKLFLTINVPYIVTSRRLRKYGLNIGDFIKFVGVNKEKQKVEGVFHYINKECINIFNEDYNEEVIIPLSYLTKNDLDYGYATNIHQLQGDEFPYIIVPFLGNIYPYQMDIEKVNNKNLRQFDMKAFYTAISRLKIKEGVGKLIIYFGEQYLDIINEIQPVIRNTPFKEIIFKQITT